MTEIQKEEYRAEKKERKRKSCEKEKEFRKSLLSSRTHFFVSNKSQEQNIQNFQLFQSKCMLEKLMRSIRSHLRL